MNTPTVTHLAVSLPTHPCAVILNDWLGAVNRFYAVYQQALAYLSHHQSTKDTSGYIGQCPLDELLVSLTRMQTQLEGLLQDINQDHGYAKPSAGGSWSLLAWHTRQLVELTNQLQLRLALCQSALA